MSSEKALKERAEKSSQALREGALSLPPERPERDVREGVAASTELGILILTKLGELQLQQARFEMLLDRVASQGDRYSDVFIEGHRSKLELEEEVTRADLDMRKLRIKRTERIWMRVLAGVLAPAALFQFWEWMKLLIQ